MAYTSTTIDSNDSGIKIQFSYQVSVTGTHPYYKYTLEYYFRYVNNKAEYGSKTPTTYVNNYSKESSVTLLGHALYSDSFGVGTIFFDFGSEATKSITIKWGISNNGKAYYGGVDKLVLPTLTRPDPPKNMASIKVNGAYKKGVAYVKMNGAWKVATKVFIKVNGVWKESI